MNYRRSQKLVLRLLVLIIAIVSVFALRGPRNISISAKNSVVALPLPTPTPLPFDLVPDTDVNGATVTDVNGLYLNPKWGEQVNNPGNFPNPLDYTKCPKFDFSGPNCSSPGQVSGVNTPTVNSVICVWSGAGSHRKNGHVNWVPATYNGSVCWDGPSLDGDYDWSVKPDNAAGLTLENHPRAPAGHPKNPQYIHTEFDYGETAAAFRSPLWMDFKKYLDPSCNNLESDFPTCDEPKGRAMVDGRRVVVTGLLGLDSEHGGYSELHPVYAMAIQTQTDSAHPQSDNWMIFARNWGNEGFCSGSTEILPPEMETLRILIPQPGVTSGEVTGVDITSDFNSFNAADCPTAIYLKGRGLLLSFNTPTVSFPSKPIRRPLIEGEIHLVWHATGTIAAPEVVACDQQLRELFREDQNEIEKALFSRVLKTKDRFQFFEIERQQEREVFHPATLSHCSALAGPVPEGILPSPNVHPATNDFAALTDSQANERRRRLALNRKFGTSYTVRKRQLMMRAVRRLKK